MSTWLVRGALAPDGPYTAKYLDFGLYPDNTPVLSLPGRTVYSPKEYCLDYAILHQHTTYQAYVAAMAFASRLRDCKTLYLPYLPGARQDNPRSLWAEEGEFTGDVLPTLQMTFTIAAAAGIKTIHVLDVHSEKAFGEAAEQGIELIDHGRQLISDLAKSVFYTHDYDGIIAPDKGAVSRALNVATALSIPLYIGTKHRDPVTNKLTGFEVKGVHEGEHYLVVDDICDAGGTFLGLASSLSEARAKGSLFVTHGLFSKGATGRLKRVYEGVYTTDSLPVADGAARFSVVYRMFDKPIEFEGTAFL